MELEDMRKHLESGGTIRVGDTWYFTKSDMECIHTVEGDPYECCAEHYSNIEETLNAILDFSDSQYDEIDLI